MLHFWCFIRSFFVSFFNPMLIAFSKKVSILFYIILFKLCLKENPQNNTKESSTKICFWRTRVRERPCSSLGCCPFSRVEEKVVGCSNSWRLLFWFRWSKAFR